MLIVSGGTGGHIWPAISFGRWLAKNQPDVAVQYMCGSRQLEREIYDAAGVSAYALPMEGSPFSGGGLKRISRAFSLLPAFGEARSMIKRFKPDCCLLFGGYISFPVLAACRVSGVPVFVQEQNARAGKVTRIASKMGVMVFSGWQECEPLKDGRYTRVGVPVREFERMSRAEAWKRLALPESAPTGPVAVVFTGSLGSVPVRDIICGAASQECFRDWTFLLPAVSEKIEKVGDGVFLLPHIWDASPLFSIADVAVMRAGGSSLTEAGTLGIPSLIIPWRKAADDHQYFNAVSYLSENTGLMWDGADVEVFTKKLLQLYEIQKSGRQITSSKLYNMAGRICEVLWAAIYASC